MPSTVSNQFSGVHILQLPATWLSPVSSLFNWLSRHSSPRTSTNKPSLREWIRVNMKKFITYVTRHIPGFWLEPYEVKTVEKLLRYDGHGRFLKRSLRPDEYVLSNGKPFVPPFVVERLKNEAAWLSYIRKHADEIPVPKLLDEYEENGSYHVWMEFVSGVEMNKLTEEQKAIVIPQVDRIVTALQKLQANHSGGSSGFLCPPAFIYRYYPAKWQKQFSPKGFVACHGDLLEANIMADPITLKVIAILDWEYAGFYPPDHEIRYYKSSDFSGTQSRKLLQSGVLDHIIEFWEKSEISTSSATS